MTTQSDARPVTATSDLTTGQLIGLAAAACGGAALVIQALTKDDEQSSKELAPVRSRLHAAVESDAVRAAEQRVQEAAPVVAFYRDRARSEVEARRKELDSLLNARGKDAKAARKQAGKRLKQAEKDLKAYRNDVRKAGKEISHVVDDQRHRVEDQLHRYGKGAAHARDRAEGLIGDGRTRASDAAASARDQSGHVGAQVAGAAGAAGLVLAHGRDRIAHTGHEAGARLDDVRSTVESGEVKQMANDRIKDLQERGAKAAEQLQSTLKDSNKDLSERLATAREQVSTFAQSSGKDLAAIAQDARDDARKNLPDVTRTVVDRASELGHQVAESASRAGKTLSERASEVSDRAPVGGDAAARAQSALHDVTSKAAAVAGPALGAIGERVGHLADDFRDDPGKRASKAVESGQSALQSASGRAASVMQNLVPVSGKSVEIVEDRASKARDKGADLSSMLQGNLPALIQQVSDLIDQAGNKGGDRLDDARKTGARLTNDAEDQLQSAADRFLEAARRAAQVGDQAVAASSHLRGTTKNAAHKTADAGKDGVESIIWLGAAGVALYYGVLSPEQRSTVNKYGARAGRMLGKLISEVRGQDQKF